MVPRPCTGGGGKTAMKASWIARELRVERAGDRVGRQLGSLRAPRTASSVTNTMPALGALMKPLIDRPGNATAFSTPGCFSAMSRHLADHRRRCGRARRASGSCAKPTRYCLSCVGHEAGRHAAEAEHGQRQQPAIDDQRDAPCAAARGRTPPHVARPTPRAKKRLNGRKNQPNTASMHARQRDPAARRAACSSSARQRRATASAN